MNDSTYNNSNWLHWGRAVVWLILCSTRGERERKKIGGKNRTTHKIRFVDTIKLRGRRTDLHDWNENACMHPPNIRSHQSILLHQHKHLLKRKTTFNSDVYFLVSSGDGDVNQLNTILFSGNHNSNKQHLRRWYVTKLNLMRVNPGKSSPVWSSSLWQL